MEAKKQGISEDWLSFWLGMVVFVLGLGVFFGLDLLGWGIKTSVWMDITKALSPVSGYLQGYAGTDLAVFDLSFYAGPDGDRRHRC